MSTGTGTEKPGATIDIVRKKPQDKHRYIYIIYITITQSCSFQTPLKSLECTMTDNHQNNSNENGRKRKRDEGDEEVQIIEEESERKNSKIAVSKAWLYFTKIGDGLNMTAKCNFKKFCSLGSISDPFGFDALQYWRENHHVFPILSNMARKYLTNLGSSATVERTFKPAKMIGESNRSSMLPRTLEDFHFLRENCDSMSELLKTKRTQIIEINQTTQ